MNFPPGKLWDSTVKRPRYLPFSSPIIRLYIAYAVDKASLNEPRANNFMYIYVNIVFVYGSNMPTLLIKVKIKLSLCFFK